MDLTYRNDLRALNDTNFARFEAVLEARFAQAELRLEQRFREWDVRLEKRFAETDLRIEKGFAEADLRIEKRFAQVDVRSGELEIRLHRALAQHLRWMIALWMTTTVGILAVLVAILRQSV